MGIACRNALQGIFPNAIMYLMESQARSERSDQINASV